VTWLLRGMERHRAEVIAALDQQQAP
jgi:hypothetical protein